MVGRKRGAAAGAVACWAAFAVAGASCGQKRKDSVMLMNRAVDLYKQGLHPAAVREMKAAIAEDDTNVDAHYNLAKMYQEMDRHDEAVEHLNRCLALQAGKPLYHYDLGVSYQALGKHEVAEQEYRKAIASDDRLFAAHYRLGTVLEDRGRHEDADRAYRRAIAINPRFLKPFVRLGYLYLDHDFVKEAGQVFSEAVRIDDGDAEAHNGYGRALWAEQRFPEAVQEFSAALEIDRDLLGALYNLGMTYADMGDGDKAQEHLNLFAGRATGNPGVHQDYVRAAQDKVAALTDPTAIPTATDLQALPPLRLKSN